MNFKTSFLTLMFVVTFCSGVFSKNIAVIPFTNITQDESKDWIGAGFSETLTTKLGKVKSIDKLGNCYKANADYKKACELGYEKACSDKCY